MKREFWRWVGERFEKCQPAFAEVEAVEASTELYGAGPILILPPIWDHHGHIAWLATQLRQIDLSGCATRSDALRAISGRAARTPNGSWLVGIGWDHNRWGGEFPDRWELDSVTGGHPAYLTRIDAHCAWFNSAAMAAAGLSELEPDPPGGVFHRSEGRISGIAVDNAMPRLEAAIPRQGQGDFRDGLLAALELLKDCGLSGATDMGLEAQVVETLSGLERDGALPVAVDGFVNTSVEGWELVTSENGAAFKLRGGKVFMDGALGSRGAALESDYSDDPGNRGLLLESRESLGRKLDIILERGTAAAIHVIGDRSLKLALEVLEGRNASPKMRFEHLQLLPGEDLPRVKNTGAEASLQPCHFLSDRPWACERLGERAGWAYRLGSIARAGLPILIGTDFPIEHPDPRRNIFAALSRESAAEKLTLAQILNAMSPPADMAGCFLPTFAAGEPILNGSEPSAVMEWKLVAGGRP